MSAELLVKWQIVGQESQELPRIDLDKERREEQNKVYTASRRIGLIVIGILFYACTVLTSASISYYHQRHVYQTLVNDKTSYNARFNKLTRESALLDNERAAWRKQMARINRRRGWGDLLYSVASISPKGVYLDYLQVQGSSSNSPIIIEGSTSSIHNIRSYADALTKSPVLADIHLSESLNDVNAMENEVKFKIEATGLLQLTDD